MVSTHANAGHHSLKPMEAGGVFQHSMPLATFTGVHGALLTPMRLGVTSVVQPGFDTARFAELIDDLSQMSFGGVAELIDAVLHRTNYGLEWRGSTLETDMQRAAF